MKRSRPAVVRPSTDGPARTLQAVPEPASSVATLTRREREVLALIAAGRSNEAIRDALVLSPKTVESHVRNIFRKLDLPRGADVHVRVLAARAWLQASPSTARAA